MSLEQPSQLRCAVRSCTQVGDRLWALDLIAPQIASIARPGQFVNIRVSDGLVPLLRRPFSISSVSRTDISILVQVVGTGTQILADADSGDSFDIIGPLGTPFTTDFEPCDCYVIGGGVGIAPMPFLSAELSRKGNTVLPLIGARTASGLVLDGLTNPIIATDDGSRGVKGTVLDLLRARLPDLREGKTRIFGCGPTPMLRALRSFAIENRIPCELSLEGAMACGIGICQGCPVRKAEGEKKYALVCHDGPVFDASTIVLD